MAVRPRGYEPWSETNPKEKRVMTSLAYSLPIGLERKRVVLVQPVVKSIVASRSSAKLVLAMNGFKTIAWSLVFLVVITGLPALAAKGLRHDANWYACEQNPAPCRPSSFGTCVLNTNCAPRAPVPKPMQDDNWPANMILGYAIIRLSA
jgi:hypothetical protein